MGIRQSELKRHPGAPICLLSPTAKAAIKPCESQLMSKRENDANNVFRPSDSPLTEHEKEQIALRKNLERLRAQRLAREAANATKKRD